MFKYARIGDRVWSIIDGWGKIVKTAHGGLVMRVNFYDGGNDMFTVEGKRFPADKYPTLYWDEIKFNIPDKPQPDLKVDTKVLVWGNEGDKKEVRYFKRFSEYGKIFCFPYGTTSSTVKGGYEDEWEYWELAKEEEK